MKKIFVVFVLLGLSLNAKADVFNLGAGYTNLETVRVGDAGNAADTRVMATDGTTGYGSVAYNYNIGKYEVTAGQYTDFLNNKAKCDGDPYGLYNPEMDDAVNNYGCNIKRRGGGTVANPYIYTVASDWANRPVNYVSYWDSLRFTNWLNNGQSNCDTETGTYNLNGYNGNDGRTIQRNAGATWAVTSEDEWYKAAYYNGGGTIAGYWLYPTQSDAAPSNQLVNPTDPGNNATYYHNGYTIGSPYYRTEVGAHENSASAYGTFDQGGNVWEWNEAVLYQDTNYAFRSLRGDSFYADYGLQSTFRNYDNPGYEGGHVGFRVSQVPEPSSVVALLVCIGGFVSSAIVRRK